ncbi:MAG: DUF2752 domain-containing protein [Acidobacteria bacterium]|nr:MAG: DUF2752 domain-containing protein [Acidobacteriota bacterium]REK02056.1 MAG: DUF2752 domain-containing protein [Acidobacteriota bacterium]REK15014.1 MAG: DUF2752 domain-containing protein [Acidobacteriota bacterium]REK45728.1 MAG: DUF2752 domain-containing protein [Acidobacteriota bacterium]
MLNQLGPGDKIKPVPDFIYKTPERVLAASGLAAIGAGSFLVWFFDPGKASFFPGCPLLNVTGFACPGCGLTRGFHELFHGDFVAALDFNALVPVWALLFAFLAVLFASIAVRGRGFKLNFVNTASISMFLGISAVFGILRNIPSEPFSVLFP